VAMTLIGVVKALKQTLNRILSGPQLSFWYLHIGIIN
jgi:hypothetical protein